MGIGRSSAGTGMPLNWAKSSYSSNEHDSDCIEVASTGLWSHARDVQGSSELTWVKSTHSTADGPSCVEAAATVGAVHVRDSKDREGPRLAFPSAAWSHFVDHAGTS